MGELRAQPLVQKAVIGNPAPGSVLSGPNATFTWSQGTGTQYRIDVGSSGAGTANLFTQNTGTSLTQLISNLPTNGSTIYVRLSTLLGTVWQFNDYTYTANSGVGKAVMQSPTPGSTLPSSTVTFNWSAGTGADQYHLYVGSGGVGSNNLFSQNTGSGLSQIVPGLPTNGSLLNVRLWSLISGFWQFNDYTCTAATVATKAVMQSPVAGSVLSGPNATFTWSQGTGTQYRIDVGSSGAGTANLFTQNTGTSLTQLISNLPTNGSTIYVRLSTLLGTVWQFNDYTYTANSGVGKAVMQSPTPGSTLPSSTVTFNWSAGTGATQYHLYVGSGGVGSNNFFSQNTGTGLSQVVSGLPTNGSLLNVRLWSLIAGSWQFNDYIYTTSGSSGKAVMQTPAPGSTFVIPSVTFNWSAGTGVSQYHLYVGSTAAGSSNVFNQNTGTGTSVLVNQLPVDGSTIYVRLWSLIAGSWLFNDYSYLASGAAQKAFILLPIQGSVFTSNSVKFSWGAGSSVTQYHLYVGTAGVGSSNLFSLNTGNVQTQTIGNLPVNSSTVYVRLWSLLPSGWAYNDYTYTSQ